MSAKLTLGQFKELTKHLPDNTPIYYHAYDKGCCLNSYILDDLWFYPKDKPAIGIVINPGEDYDCRASRKIEK